MSAALIFAAILSSTVPGPDFELRKRAPVLLIEAESAVDPRVMAQVITGVLERRTKLALIPAASAGVDVARFHACETQVRLQCWVRTVRAVTDAPFVLVAGAQPGSTGGVRVSLVLVDAAQAEEIIARMAERGDTNEESIENRLFEVAVRSAAGISDASPAELEKYVESAFVGRLREPLERVHLWNAFATLEIETARAGLIIQLANQRVGVTRAGITRIGGIEAGLQELDLIDDVSGKVIFARTFTAEPGAIVQVVAGGTTPPKAVSAQPIVLWSGVGIAVIGAIFTAYALAAPSGHASHRLCYQTGCALEAPSAGFLTFSDVEDRNAELAPLDGRSGVPIAPIGYGLIGLGSAWSIGALLEDGEDVPWIAVIAGVVIGASSIALSLALD